MTTARNILTLALESMNRLSPGEAIDADLAASCLRRLNSIADDMGAGRQMLFRDLFTSSAVTGQTLTIGAGGFAALQPGDEVIQAVADGFELSPITMQQYNAILVKTSTGRPGSFAFDGLATVYLYPAAAGQTITLLTRANYAVFADLDTVYMMPSGYENAFATCLAVAMAPALLGKVSADLVRAKKEAMFNVANNAVRPAILNANPYSQRFNIFNGSY